MSTSNGPTGDDDRTPPTWLSSALHAIQARYPNDRIVIKFKRNEWRIKCLDCPRKLYQIGPGETLSNYQIHLKNREHRTRVNSRITAPLLAPLAGLMNEGNDATGTEEEDSATELLMNTSGGAGVFSVESRSGSSTPTGPISKQTHTQ